MKRAIAAVIILGIILVYSFGASIIIKNENSRLVYVLDEIQACYENSDMTSASENADKLEDLWGRYQKVMSVFVKDDKLNELDTTVAKIKPYIEEANDELEAEIQNVRHQLWLIYKTEVPYWYNLL